MHRSAIAALTLACAMTVTPALAATPAGAAVKPNLRACYDGRCTFTFTKALRFRVAKKYGLAWVRVARYNADMVVVRAPYLTALLGEGAAGSFSTGRERLSFQVLSITDRGAKIRFTG
ncbi:hypothetical protein ACGF0J_27865 [Nonomuraea sp. NPDC047897]|uniref:hypothetical protein n=1 Tax=Nonomuraea sp. NPDC047897 TaxID=3364346 RepID=UPI00371492B5